MSSSFDDIYDALVALVARGPKLDVIQGLEPLVNHPWVQSRAEHSASDYERARLVPSMLQAAADTLPKQSSDALTPLCGMGSFANDSAERRQERAAEAYGASRTYFPKAPKRELLRQLADVLHTWAIDDDGVGIAALTDGIGALAYFADFVDIPGLLWEELITGTRRLSIVMNYGSTWRNTYRKALVQAIRSGMQLDVVLPDCSPKSPLLELHAQRQQISKPTFKNKVDEAIADIRSISEDSAHVYASQVAFNHCMFLFDDSSILSFYTLSGSRDETPALHLKRGSNLDNFLRTDFQQLQSMATAISPPVISLDETEANSNGNNTSGVLTVAERNPVAPDS